MLNKTLALLLCLSSLTFFQCRDSLGVDETASALNDELNGTSWEVYAMNCDGNESEPLNFTFRFISLDEGILFRPNLNAFFTYYVEASGGFPYQRQITIRPITGGSYDEYIDVLELTETSMILSADFLNNVAMSNYCLLKLNKVD